jgi:hypothetical protein
MMMFSQAGNRSSNKVPNVSGGNDLGLIGTKG